MRVALAGTYPPLRSGITDYTVELARALGERGIEVALVGEGEGVPERVAGLGRIAPVRELEALRPDVVLAQVGSHPAHRYLRPVLVEGAAAGRPVVVDLHDWSLYDLTASCFVGRPLPFLRELVRNEGLAGLGRALATPVAPGRGTGPRARLRHALAEDPRRRERFLLNRWVIDAADAIVVHSRALEQRVRGCRADVPLWQVPHGVRGDLARVGRDAARERLDLEARGVAPGAFVVLSFGLIQRHKRIPEALAAFARLAATDPVARYVLLGPRCPEYDLDRDLDRLGLRERVLVVDGFPDIEEVALWIQAADLGVNLRGPSYGGMSGTLLKMMALGLPVVATPVAELAHLPAGALSLVEAGPGEVEELARTFGELARDAGRRRALGAAGRRLIEDGGYLWPAVAGAYAGLFEQVVRPRRVC